MYLNLDGEKILFSQNFDFNAVDLVSVLGMSGLATYVACQQDDYIVSKSSVEDGETNLHDIRLLSGSVFLFSSVIFDSFSRPLRDVSQALLLSYVCTEVMRTKMKDKSKQGNLILTDS